MNKRSWWTRKAIETPGLQSSVSDTSRISSDLPLFPSTFDPRPHRQDAGRRTNSRVCYECVKPPQLTQDIASWSVSCRHCARTAVGTKSTDLKYHRCKGAARPLKAYSCVFYSPRLVKTVADVIRT